MRIWMHLLLAGIAEVIGFFAAAVLIYEVLQPLRDLPKWVRIPIVCVVGLTFPYGGIRLGEWLVRLLPARCPKCGGRAYAEGHRPIRFRCRQCEHVHRTNECANWGKD